MPAGAVKRRPNVPVSDRLLQGLHDTPEAYGFAPGLSEAKMLAELAEEGARVRRETTRRTERIEIYRAWADDPECREATEQATRIAKASGLV